MASIRHCACRSASPAPFSPSATPENIACRITYVEMSPFSSLSLVSCQKGGNPNTTPFALLGLGFTYILVDGPICLGLLSRVCYISTMYTIGSMEEGLIGNSTIAVDSNHIVSGTPFRKERHLLYLSLVHSLACCTQCGGEISRKTMYPPSLTVEFLN